MPSWHRSNLLFTTRLCSCAQQITALYDKCNAAAIAAAKLNASTVKYETLFPCTKTLTSTQFDPEGLDTCG